MRLRHLALCPAALGLPGPSGPIAPPAAAAELRINIPADPAMVDPITYSELVAGDILQNVYEGFVGLDDDGNIVPALAEVVDRASRQSRLHLQAAPGREIPLRPAVHRQGREIHLRAAAPPGQQGRPRRRLSDRRRRRGRFVAGTATEISGVKVIDDHTVDVTFTKPDVLFPIYPFYFMDSGIVAELGPDWYLQGLGRHRPVQVRRLEPRPGRQARRQCGLLGRRAEDRRRRLPDRALGRHRDLACTRRTSSTWSMPTRRPCAAS